eukprot:271044-Hanusia_phi.AAC.1
MVRKRDDNSERWSCTLSVGVLMKPEVLKRTPYWLDFFMSLWSSYGFQDNDMDFRCRGSTSMSWLKNLSSKYAAAPLNGAMLRGCQAEVQVVESDKKDEEEENQVTSIFEISQQVRSSPAIAVTNSLPQAMSKSRGNLSLFHSALPVQVVKTPNRKYVCDVCRRGICPDMPPRNLVESLRPSPRSAPLLSSSPSRFLSRLITSGWPRMPDGAHRFLVLPRNRSKDLRPTSKNGDRSMRLLNLYRSSTRRSPRSLLT